MYTYTNELFPTNVRFLAMNMFFCVNRLTGAVVPVILNYTENIAIYMAMLSFFSILLICLLPESMNHDPGTEIIELKDEIYFHEGMKMEYKSEDEDGLNNYFNKSF